MRIKNNLIPDAVLREYVCSAEKDMRQASGLLPLKVRLSCVNKKLAAFTRAGEAQRVVGDMPCRDGDYFKLEQNTSFGGFFEQKRHWFTAASAPVSAVPCTAGKHCV